MMTVASAITPVIETANRVLDDRIYEHTIIRRTKRGEVRHTVQLNGWHILGGVAVAGALLWSGMALGLLRWQPYKYTVKENGKETTRTINLPSADNRGNERLGVKPMVKPADWITGTWLSPLGLIP